MLTAEKLMSVVEVDRATGALVVEGRTVFPLILSDGPPLGAKTPAGVDALAELAAGGASFIRTGRSVWSPDSIDQQIAADLILLQRTVRHQQCVAIDLSHRQADIDKKTGQQGPIRVRQNPTHR